MEKLYNRSTVFRIILFTIVVLLLPSAKAFAALADTLVVAKEELSRNDGGRLIDRFAFKTNALEWLLTIPNFGVEFDLKGSEYNDMTVGLNAKYNWNTYHQYTPTAAFNLLDIRPEFRYWYRTRKPDVYSAGKKWWHIDKILKVRKNPRHWRAQYVGAYVNYANYTIKLSRQGYQGQVVGLGATTGYSFPMYEYKKGSIDVELGFSVGLQAATKDVFVHNPEGYYYSYVEKDDRMGFTPFPVVSELKVAFVYRTKSIKDKVKTDTERIRIKAHFDKIKTDYISALTGYTKDSYEERLKNVMGESGLKRTMANDSLYRKGFKDMLNAEEKMQVEMIASAFPDEMKNHERQDLRDYVKGLEIDLEQLVGRAKTSAWKQFERDAAKAAASRRKALKKEAAKKSVEDAAKKTAGDAAKKPEDTKKVQKPEKATKVEKAEKTEKTEKPIKEKKVKEKPVKK